MAVRIYVLDGGGPKDSENTPNSFLTKCGEKVFWQIGADMKSSISVFYLVKCIYVAPIKAIFGP